MKPTIITSDIKEAQGVFDKDVAKMQGKFVDALTKSLFKGLETKNGKIVNNEANKKFISLLQTEVLRINKAIGLDNSIQGLFANFDDLNANLAKLHKEQSGIKIANSSLDEFKAYAIDNLTNSLKGQGMNEGFTAPIRTQLLKSMLVGGDIVSTINGLEATLGGIDGGKGQFERYYTQVSRDSLFQYAGTVNQAVANKYELDGIMYIGSVVEDSRAQCERWLSKSPFALADLVDEINWAYNNGTGMIAGTTPENFFINRGGYNCRHEAFPVRLKQ